MCFTKTYAILIPEKLDMNKKINEAVDVYFNDNPETQWFPVKKIMPLLIKARVFIKDKKNGMPLRKVLRDLDKLNQLNDIPRVYAERVGVDIYWYFVREGVSYVSDKKDPSTPSKKELKAVERANNDENYLIGLIDGLMEKEGSRKHKFDFLLGDLHQNEKKRTKLPIDLYYKHKRLALEFVKHPEELSDANKSLEEKLTVSGITRAEQRFKYYQRKKKTLQERAVNFIEVPIERFEVDDTFKLIRTKTNDERVLRELLSSFID